MSVSCFIIAQEWNVTLSKEQEDVPPTVKPKMTVADIAGKVRMILWRCKVLRASGFYCLNFSHQRVLFGVHLAV